MTHATGISAGTRRAARAGRARPRLAALLLTALVGSATAAPPSGAVPVGPALVVSGGAATRGTFTLSAPVRLDLRAIDVLTTGTYGGVFIRSESGVDYGGGLWARALDAAPAPPALYERARPLYGRYWAQPTLPAGTYRVDLVGDAATEASIPLLEGSATTVRTSEPGSHVLRTVTADVAPDVDTDTDTTAVTYAFTKPARSLSFVVGEFSSTLTTENPSIWLCLRQSRTGRCMTQATSGMPATTGGGLGIDSMLRPTRRAQAWRAEVSVSTRTSNGGRLALAYLQLGP